MLYSQTHTNGVTREDLDRSASRLQLKRLSDDLACYGQTLIIETQRLYRRQITHASLLMLHTLWFAVAGGVKAKGFTISTWPGRIISYIVQLRL